MRFRVHSEHPESWSARRKKVTSGWMVPFSAFEWFWGWVAYALAQWSFLEVLEYLGSFSVLVAVIFYFAESGDRLKQKHYQAWQVINTAQGKGGSGGRLDALQELNADRVALVGVDVSTAFLNGINLSRAHLGRSNFNAVEAQGANFSSANFSDADLHFANFRYSKFRQATLRNANLNDVDFWQADLTGANLSGASLNDADLHYADLQDIQWKDISSLKNANLFGVKNPPQGFLPWALQHGAIQTESDPPAQSSHSSP